MKSVAEIAFKDISKHIKESSVVKDSRWEVWNVTPRRLNNKENRRLNKELGLRGINCRIENTI